MGGRAQRYADYDFVFDAVNGLYKPTRSSALITDPTLLPGYSYSRSGAKSELNANGTPVAFAANSPGIVPGVGYWSRAALTNLLLRSQEFDDAVWIAANVNFTPNSIAAPDGSVSADKLTAAAAATTYIRQSTSTGAGSVTVSVFAKAGTCTVLQICDDHDGAGNTSYCNFDLANGVVGSFSGSTARSITSIGGGWYLCQVTLTATASTAPTFFVLTSTASSARAVAPASGAFLYLWQAQLVAGTQSGPIIATAGTAAALGADPLWFTSPITTDEDFVFWATVNADTLIGGSFMATLSDGSLNNELSVHNRISSSITAFIRNGGGAFNGAISAQALTGRCVSLVRRRAGKITGGIKTGGVVTVGAEQTATKSAPHRRRTHDLPDARSCIHPLHRRNLQGRLQRLSPRHPRDDSRRIVAGPRSASLQEQAHGVSRATASGRPGSRAAIHWFISTRPRPRSSPPPTPRPAQQRSCGASSPRSTTGAKNRDWFDWKASTFTMFNDPTAQAQAIALVGGIIRKRSPAPTRTMCSASSTRPRAIARVIFNVFAGAMTTPGARWVMRWQPDAQRGVFLRRHLREAEGAQARRPERGMWNSFVIPSWPARSSTRRGSRDAPHARRGEDEFRVRVLGLPPRTDVEQFISARDGHEGDGAHGPDVRALAADPRLRCRPRRSLRHAAAPRPQGARPRSRSWKASARPISPGASRDEILLLPRGVGARGECHPRGARHGRRRRRDAQDMGYPTMCGA
jgi:hypothetical protein